MFAEGCREKNEFLGYGGCRISMESDGEKAIVLVKKAVAEWSGSVATSMLERSCADIGFPEPCMRVSVCGVCG